MITPESHIYTHLSAELETVPDLELEIAVCHELVSKILCSWLLEHCKRVVLLIINCTINDSICLTCSIPYNIRVAFRIKSLVGLFHLWSGEYRFEWRHSDC